MACRHTAWVPWLQAAATIDDCKLSSHAARALLHLESARCFPSNDTYQFEHNLYEPDMLQRCGLPRCLSVCLYVCEATVPPAMSMLLTTSPHFVGKAEPWYAVTVPGGVLSYRRLQLSAAQQSLFHGTHCITGAWEDAASSKPAFHFGAILISDSCKSTSYAVWAMLVQDEEHSSRGAE